MDSLMEELLRGAADRAVDYLSHHRRVVEVKAVESSKAPAEVILATLHEGRYGLLVMGALGQPRIREFFLGSTTRSVLKAAGCPVFLYH